MQPHIPQKNCAARVYLHPAAVISPGALRTIEILTGREAYVASNDHRIHLLTPAEVARYVATDAKAGGA